MTDEAPLPVGPYALPPLRYDHGALAPWIDEATLREHHDHHHRQAVEHLNAVLARRPEWLGMTIERLLSRVHDVPQDIRAAVLQHGGCHANHQFLWKVLSPPDHGSVRAQPHGTLLAALVRDFGGVDAFRRQFENAARSLQGPGWAFLVADPTQHNRLAVVALPENGSVLPLGRLGLLICDLWPHAYARHYGENLDRWLDAWWRLVDWQVVEQRHQRFTGAPVAF